MPRCPRRSIEQIKAGAAALKLHEDWGTTPAAIDCCLAVADDLRRAGDDPHRHARTSPASSRTPSPPSRAAPSTPSTPKAPAAAMRPTSSRSAASPTCCRPRPIRRGPTRSTRIDEHLDMLMVCHHLDPTHPRGRRLRREPHPQGDHRRRGHPPRPRRLLDDRLRQPGDGPRRRGADPHLADRPQDEACSAAACPRRPATTTISASSATSPNTRSTRRSPMASTNGSARSRSASSPTSCSGRRPSSASSPTWCSSSAPSPPRRWAIPTPRSRRRSRCTTGRCSAPSARR